MGLVDKEGGDKRSQLGSPHLGIRLRGETLENPQRGIQREARCRDLVGEAMENFLKYYRRICIVFAAVSSAAIALMMLSTSLDTSLRYAFNTPLPGVFELNEVLLVVTVFLGIAWTQAERGHTRVVLVMRRVEMRTALKMDILCWIMCFLFLGALGVQSAKEAFRSFSINEFRWGAVQMPIWWAKGLVPFGCFLTCIQLLMDIWRDVRMLMGRLPMDIPDFGQTGE